MGVIVWMGNVLSQYQHIEDKEGRDITDWVDQMMRYIPELAITLNDKYAQKQTCMAVWNHCPLSGIPYWHIFVRIVPTLHTYQPSNGAFCKE